MVLVTYTGLNYEEIEQKVTSPEYRRFVLDTGPSTQTNVIHFLNWISTCKNIHALVMLKVGIVVRDLVGNIVHSHNDYWDLFYTPDDPNTLYAIESGDWKSNTKVATLKIKY